MIPTQLHTSRKSMTLFMAGGLLLNFLSFLTCLYLIGNNDLGNGWLVYFVYATAFVAILLFVSNALRLKTMEL